MTAGESFVKSIRPIGCVLFVLVLALFLLFAFLSGGGQALDVRYTPTPGLDPADPLALETELETRLLPLLPGKNSCYVDDGKLWAELESAYFSDCRATILHYYPDSGVNFKRK